MDQLKKQMVFVCFIQYFKYYLFCGAFLKLYTLKSYINNLNMRNTHTQQSHQKISFSPFPHKRGVSPQNSFHTFRNKKVSYKQPEINNLQNDPKNAIQGLHQQLYKIKLQISKIITSETQNATFNYSNKFIQNTKSNQYRFSKVNSQNPYGYHIMRDSKKKQLNLQPNELSNNQHILISKQNQKGELNTSLIKQKTTEEQKINKLTETSHKQLKFGIGFRQKNAFKSIQKYSKTIQYEYKKKIDDLTKKYENQAKQLKLIINNLQNQLKLQQVNQKSQLLQKQTINALKFNRKFKKSFYQQNSDNLYVKGSNNPEKQQQTQNQNNQNDELKNFYQLLNQKVQKINNLQLKITLLTEKQIYITQKYNYNNKILDQNKKFIQKLQHQIKQKDQNINQLKQQKLQLRIQLDKKQKFSYPKKPCNLQQKLIIQLKKKEKMIELLINDIKYFQKKQKQLDYHKKIQEKLQKLVQYYNQTKIVNNLNKLNSKYSSIL